MSQRSPDRRRIRRRQRVEEHGVVRARVRPGARVRIVDISALGTLVETTCRLLPGSTLELQVETGDRQETTIGRVMRCSVSRVCSMYVSYRGAIQFDRPLSWLLEEAPDGNLVPAAEPQQTPQPWEDTTRRRV